MYCATYIFLRKGNLLSTKIQSSIHLRQILNLIRWVFNCVNLLIHNKTVSEEGCNFYHGAGNIEHHSAAWPTTRFCRSWTRPCYSCVGKVLKCATSREKAFTVRTPMATDSSWSGQCKHRSFPFSSAQLSWWLTLERRKWNTLDLKSHFMCVSSSHHSPPQSSSSLFVSMYVLVENLRKPFFDSLTACLIHAYKVFL